MKRIVIIGAGPCGLGAAYRLKELGHDNFTVYERHPYVGGLATSFCDSGFFWDLGCHIIHSNYEYFDRITDNILGDDRFTHKRELLAGRLTCGWCAASGWRRSWLAGMSAFPLVTPG
jgi:protoporphyrinogen oxidase